MDVHTLEVHQNMVASKAAALSEVSLIGVKVPRLLIVVVLHNLCSEPLPVADTP